MPHLLPIRAIRLFLIGVFALLGVAADAACLRNVADLRPGLVPVRFGPGAVPPGHVGLTYIGHASFLIETAAGITIVTDYNDYVRPDITPDVVTMNNAHSTHYSLSVDPGVRHVLQGWGDSNGPATHELTVEDVRIFNVPTNVREFDGTRKNGNSIFVFETAGLCIAHLGHLHHRLTREHLAMLGQIDVLMVPVDGSYTLNLQDMTEVIEQIRAPLVIPMHYFTADGLERFLATYRGRGTSLDYDVNISATASVLLSRDRLPARPEILVLPGH
ncbi:MAG TPA: MBL fold metallo-hydrolase [Alphaproteobacteria bacterium]